MRTSVFITEHDFSVYKNNTEVNNIQLMTFENVRLERETETFVDFSLSQITFYFVIHNENQRNQQPHYS